MNKTLHKKLIEKPSNQHTPAQVYARMECMLAGDLALLKEAAKDLLQPRPQAVANILALSRNL